MSLVFASVHFSWAELACHDGTEVPEALRPVARRACLTVLEPIRQRFGKALVVVSGYRSRTHNRRVGGARESRHVKADGFDIRPVSFADLPRLKQVVREMIDEGALPDLGGYGEYPRWIHVDARPRKLDGSIARWDGNATGSER